MLMDVIGFISAMWQQYLQVGEVLLAGYFFHFLPFFFVDRTLFLHHYLPAYAFKVMLAAFVALHLVQVLSKAVPSAKAAVRKWSRRVLLCLVLAWVLLALNVFRHLSVLAYGFIPLSAEDVRSLKWKDTWDLIVHKP